MFGDVGYVVVDELVVVDPVQHIVVRLLAVTVNVRPRGVESLLSCIKGCRADGDRARNQQRQLIVVARFERQAGDRAGLHHRADIGRLRLQHRRGTRNLHGGRHLADGQRNIHFRHLV